MDSRLRDILMFSAGLAVLGQQMLFAESVSPALVGASLTMMIGARSVYRLLDKVDNPPKGDDK